VQDSQNRHGLGWPPENLAFQRKFPDRVRDPWSQSQRAFHRTNPAKPPDCRRSRPNQHGHPAAASQFVGSTRPRVSFEQSTRSFPGTDRYVREKSAGPGRWLVDLQRSSSHRTEPALHYNLRRKVES
jgi:hypothetical protein